MGRDSFDDDSDRNAKQPKREHTICEDPCSTRGEGAYHSSESGLRKEGGTPVAKGNEMLRKAPGDVSAVKKAPLMEAP